MTASLNPGRPFAGIKRQLLKNTLNLQRSELLAAGGLSDAQVVIGVPLFGWPGALSIQ